jgi:hypothetical protein
MIKYIRFLVLLIFVAVTGCDESKPAAQEGNVAAEAATNGSTPGDFYKRLTGTIAGRPAVVQLHKFGTLVAGYYQYEGANLPVKIINWSDTVADNNYHLTEVDNDGDAQDITGATWDIVVNGNAVTGKWTSPDGQSVQDISLQEEYPAGSIRLDAFYFTDTAQMFKTIKYPQANVTYGGVYPPQGEKGERNAFLRSAIATHMNLEGGNGMIKGFEVRSWRYFGNYRLDLASVIDSNASEAERRSMGYQYNASFYHNVLYNDNNWLVLEDAVAEYTGGAHGTYSSSYQNLDLTASRSWRLDDIVRDTAHLKPLLETAVRAHFKIKTGEQLGSRLLVDHVPVTPNVYLTPSGLVFVYQPYEIASYADGVIQLFIPYTGLMSLLSPEFINRQKLGTQGGVVML